MYFVDLTNFINVRISLSFDTRHLRTSKYLSLRKVGNKLGNKLRNNRPWIVSVWWPLVGYFVKICDLELRTSKFELRSWVPYDKVLIYIQLIHRINPYAFIAFNQSELINSLSILENLILNLARKFMVPQLMEKEFAFLKRFFETNSENHFWLNS